MGTLLESGGSAGSGGLEQGKHPVGHWFLELDEKWLAAGPARVSEADGQIGPLDRVDQPAATRLRGRILRTSNRSASRVIVTVRSR